MSFVIRIERVKELAEQVKAAFLKTRMETFRDLMKIEKENKNKVNAEIAARKTQVKN